MKEKKSRLTNEKAILKEIHHESKSMQNQIVQESIKRQEKMTDLDEFLS